MIVQSRLLKLSSVLNCLGEEYEKVFCSVCEVATLTEKWLMIIILSISFWSVNSWCSNKVKFVQYWNYAIVLDNQKLYSNGSGRGYDFNLILGLVGLGHLHNGSRWVGSRKLDPCTTLCQNIAKSHIGCCWPDDRTCSVHTETCNLACNRPINESWSHTENQINLIYLLHWVFR